MKSCQFLERTLKRSLGCPLQLAVQIACALVLTLLISVPSLIAQQSEVPKQLPEAKATDCAACHGVSSPLPKDHPDPAAMTLKDCRQCHAIGTQASLTGKLPLSHVHQLAGVTCGKCHADPKNPEAVPAKDCMKCHDGEKVAAVTAVVKPRNPHDSPHYGKDSDCNLCHHQHEKSENYCSQCHNYKFSVP